MDGPIAEIRKQRSWSQSQLIQRMRGAAIRTEIQLPDDNALRISLSRWEHGYHRPSALYRRLLAEALEVTEGDLGFAPSAQDCVCEPNSEYVAYLGAMFQLHAKADQQVGSRMLLTVVREQTTTAEVWTRGARGEIREPMLRLVSRYSEFCGWLHQDQNDFSTADEWTKRAIEMSQELSDRRLVAYALTRRSNIATESGRPLDGLNLAESALRQTADLDARLIALSLRQKAAAHALLGEGEDCFRAVQDSIEAAAGGDQVTHPESDYCTLSYVSMEGAQALLTTGSTSPAIHLFNEALRVWPAGQERDRGLCLARLANAYAQAHEIEAACEAGRASVTTLTSAPSARTQSALRRLRGRLDRTRRRPEVMDLREQLARAI